MKLIQKITAAGFAAKLKGDGLIISPRKNLTPEQIKFITDNKPAIVQELRVEKYDIG